MTDTVRDVVRCLTDWVRRLMPEEDRRAALITALHTAHGADDSEVTAASCAAVERTAWAHARHVALIFEPSGTLTPDTEAHEWEQPTPAAVRARAGCVSRVERLPDGTGVLRVEGLDPVALAGPYLEAAFAHLTGARRLVLDMRANGGGDPATVALIAGRLLGDTAVQLSEVVGPAGRRQWWTADSPPGTALLQDAWLLTGPGTFSSGEALAYHLRARGRVTIVGEPTPGAADHVLPIRLTPTVLAHVPRAYVLDTTTGTNWEGTGVLPDIACPAGEALTTALAAA